MRESNLALANRGFLDLPSLGLEAASESDSFSSGVLCLAFGDISASELSDSA